MIIEAASVRRLLIIKLRAIGDVLLSTIVLPNLRNAFPESAVDFLTEPPAAPIVQANALVDDVIVFDRSSVSATWLICEVRRRRYDLVIDLFGNPRTALVTRLSGAKHRVGFAFSGRTYAYSTAVRPKGGEVHNTQFNLDALEAIGVPIVDRRIHFPVSQHDVKFAKGFFSKNNVSNEPVVALNSGGGWSTKRWGLDKFAEVGNRLNADRGVKVLLVWGPGELPDIESIQARLMFKPLVPPLTSLGQLGALLRMCSLLITNDSGPMHIAAALGTPVVGIFGPTSPDLQGPYGTKNIIVKNDYLHCLGCNNTRCPIGHPCMLGLSVDKVLAAAYSILGQRSEAASVLDQ